MGCERALGIAWRFEPLHPLLALARQLVGIFRAIIQINWLRVLEMVLTSCRI